MKILTNIGPNEMALALAIAARQYGVDGRLTLAREVYDSMPKSVSLSVEQDSEGNFVLVLGEDHE